MSKVSTQLIIIYKPPVNRGGVNGDVNGGVHGGVNGGINWAQQLKHQRHDDGRNLCQISQVNTQLIIIYKPPVNQGGVNEGVHGGVNGDINEGEQLQHQRHHNGRHLCQISQVITRYCFTSKLYCGSLSPVYCPPPPSNAYPIAKLPYAYCAIYAPPSTLPLYAIHHTILVMTVSCKGQNLAGQYTTHYPIHTTCQGVNPSTGHTHTHTRAEQTTHPNTERAMAQRRLIVEVVVAAPKIDVHNTVNGGVNGGVHRGVKGGVNGGEQFEQ